MVLAFGREGLTTGKLESQGARSVLGTLQAKRFGPTLGIDGMEGTGGAGLSRFIKRME